MTLSRYRALHALALAFLERNPISIKDLIGTGKSQKRFDEDPKYEPALQIAQPLCV